MGSKTAFEMSVVGMPQDGPIEKPVVRFQVVLNGVEDWNSPMPGMRRMHISKASSHWSDLIGLRESENPDASETFRALESQIKLRPAQTAQSRARQPDFSNSIFSVQ